MRFFRLSAQRASNIWNYSRVNTTGAVGVIESSNDFVFAYDFWSNEPIFSDIGYWFVRRSVGRDLLSNSLTGFALTDVKTRKSNEYVESTAKGPIEDVALLKIHGQAGRDDFGILKNAFLIVSERSLDVFRTNSLKIGEVHDYDKDYTPPSLEEMMKELGKSR